MALHFRKMDQRFPLTKFEAYLRTRLSVGSTHALVSAMRQILAAIEEETGQAPSGWGEIVRPMLMFKAAEDYFARQSRRQQRNIQVAWAHWLGFTMALVPRLSAGREKGPRDQLAAAVGLLVHDPAFRGHHTSDICDFVWRREDEAWRVMPKPTPEDPAPRVVWPAPSFVPLLDFIRAWGYPPPGQCLDGNPFLPQYPHSAEPMPERSVHRLAEGSYKDVNRFELMFKEMMGRARLIANNELMMHRRSTPSTPAPETH